MTLTDLIWRADTLKEKAIQTFVWALPKVVVYWAAIRLMAHATQGEHSGQDVTELRAMDALDRWTE